MGVINNAVVFAEDAVAEAPGVAPWVFGVTAFVVLGALLVITLMLKVGD
jgi:hypothetical protein